MNRDRQNPAVEFLCKSHNGGPEELVRAYAHFLLRSANTYELPVQLGRIQGKYEIPVHHVSAGDQRGFTTEDERIYLNADDRPTVRNFTFGHELVELLFLALGAGGADAWMPDDVFVALQEGKEKYCELGAAELLMPMPLFRELVALEPLSLGWARRVAARCGVSLTAALWRILETGLANALFITWDFRHSPRQYVPSKIGQLNLFGPAEAMDPPKKMRVERVFRPPHFDAYIPKDKSVDLDGVIHLAHVTDQETSGWEEIDLVGLRGSFFVEAAPFSVDGDRRVMSLLHLDGSRDSERVRGGQPPGLPR